MKLRKRCLVTILLSTMITGIFAGCSNSDKGNVIPPTGTDSSEVKKEERITMEWLMGQTSAEVDPEAPIIKELSEEFGVDLRAWYVDSSKFQEALSVRFAAGEMPDVLILDNLSIVPTYVEGGILHEIPEEMIREKAPNYAAISDQYDDGTLWRTGVYKGSKYAVGNILNVVPHAMVWRQDWLEAVGIDKIPETLEEMEIALTKFVTEDPDGDGIDNTYGMGERAMNAVFGAYGMRICTGAKPGFLVEEMQLIDGVPVFPYIRPEAKEALGVLRDWYAKGLIDPEFITGENHGGYQWLSHSLINSRIGVTEAQPSHYYGSSYEETEENMGQCLAELKAVTPEAVIRLGKAPIGPSGKSGTEGWSKVGKVVGLTTKCFEDERKVNAFFEMLDRYYTDIEYAKLVSYGIEGEHYRINEDGGIKRIGGGTELRKQGVMQFNFGDTIPFVEAVAPKKAAFGKEVTGEGYFRFNAPPTQEFSSAIATLDTLTEQTYFDIITGVKPLDYFDEYVKQFKEAGGELAEKSVQEAYAEIQKGDR